MFAKKKTYSLQINQEDIGKINAIFIGKIIELNDKRIVIQRSMKPLNKLFSWLFILLCAGGLVTYMVFGVHLWQKYDIPIGLFILIVLFSLFLINIVVIQAIRLPVREEQYIIFDREHYTITMPRNSLTTKPVTYSYKDIHLHRYYRNAEDHSARIGSARVVPWYDYIMVKPDNNENGEFIKFWGAAGTNLCKKSSWRESNRYKDFWDYMKHYMTKGRPLPPGTAFDPYRK